MTDELPVTPPAKPTRKRKPYKLDRSKVKKLAMQGMSNPDIAKHQGVAPSTVYRFLSGLKIDRPAVEEFKKHRADVLARVQAKNIDLHEALVEKLEVHCVAGALKPGQMINAIHALNNSTGTMFDKERLERGESTSNSSLIVTNAMSKAFDNLYPDQGMGIGMVQSEKQSQVIDVTASDDVK